jgi:hypothetical protein
LFSLAVQGVQDEGKHAIDSPGKAINADMPPEEYALGKNIFFLKSIADKNFCV